MTDFQKKQAIEQLNQKENDLIKEFKSHPLFQKLPLMTWEKFLEILIQRRFLSLSIVPSYELVIDSLEQEEIKKVVRQILYEEYPSTSKGVPLLSHRELLFQDLLNLGATREKILTTPETDVTKRIRESGLKIFSQNFGNESFQVGLIAAIRFWGEVMVAEEYRCLWKKISEKLSALHNEPNKQKSEFYYFHMVHDNKGSDIGSERFCGGVTHSQILAKKMAELINSENDLKYCMDIQSTIYKLKYKFYEQFL